mmetsp:Transcript_31551/g.90560  ORF Transcript_31551/g.90560 Transcript_31551/m.90560 type:complete len:270 (-) Transcript_31551:279-1088(-)
MRRPAAMCSSVRLSRGCGTRMSARAPSNACSNGMLLACIAKCRTCVPSAGSHASLSARSSSSCRLRPSSATPAACRIGGALLRSQAETLQRASNSAIASCTWPVQRFSWKAATRAVRPLPSTASRSQPPGALSMPCSTSTSPRSTASSRSGLPSAARALASARMSSRCFSSCLCARRTATASAGSAPRLSSRSTSARPATSASASAQDRVGDWQAAHSGVSPLTGLGVFTSSQAKLAVSGEVASSVGTCASSTSTQARSSAATAMSREL